MCNRLLFTFLCLLLCCQRPLSDDGWTHIRSGPIADERTRSLMIYDLLLPTSIDEDPLATLCPPDGISPRWEVIVVHHSAADSSTPESMTNDHVNNRGWQSLGYHFCISNAHDPLTPDGEIYAGERWWLQQHGAHCKSDGNYYNEHGIGICLIGNLENHRPTEAQMRSLRKLITYLRSQLPGIQVIGHGDVGATLCPGRHLNLSEFQDDSKG